MITHRPGGSTGLQPAPLLEVEILIDDRRPHILRSTMHQLSTLGAELAHQSLSFSEQFPSRDGCEELGAPPRGLACESLDIGVGERHHQ